MPLSNGATCAGWRMTPFDLLVVGAGIYGALAAWDATARGLGSR